MGRKGRYLIYYTIQVLSLVNIRVNWHTYQNIRYQQRMDVIVLTGFTSASVELFLWRCCSFTSIFASSLNCEPKSVARFCVFVCVCVYYSAADPGFQVRGAHLKKLHRTKGGAKIFGLFRVKNHDFTPKNHIFSNFRIPGSAPAIYQHILNIRCLPHIAWHINAKWFEF
jgi:hypothetical protein